MTNIPVAQEIARALQEGFVHPGDPEQEIPPTPVILPFKPAPGQPKEMADLMTGTAKLLSECIVALIEKDYEIVPREQASAMRMAISDGPDGPTLMALHCRCDTTRTDPLAILTVTDEAIVVVDGPTLLRSLTKRTVAHPHPIGPTEPEAVSLAQSITELMDEFNKRQLPASTRKRLDEKLSDYRGDE